MFSVKRITIPNEDAQEVTFRVFSSNPQGVEIVTPDLVIPANGKGKIGMVFKKNGVQEEKSFTIYIFKNKEPLEKIMLTAKYASGG